MIQELSDTELIAALKALVGEEREISTKAVEHLIEFDRRKLYADLGYTSLFMYCTRELGYSEDAACNRIYTARAVAEYPMILGLLRKGALSMTAVVRVRPYLTRENHEAVLLRASGMNIKDIEYLIAELAPRPDSGDVIRHQAAFPSAAEESSLESGDPSGGIREGSMASTPEEPLHLRQRILPTSPDRIRFAFTASEQLLRLLRRAQDVLRHKYPAGDLEKIFFEALEALLDRKDPERKLQAKEEKAAAGLGREPRPQSVWAFAMRAIPQAVRDFVWRRDGGQCVFVDPQGTRCEERGGLEFDHIIPFALGGPSNNPKNIRLLCKTHNLMMARRSLGETALRRQLGLGGPSAGGASPSASG